MDENSKLTLREISQALISGSVLTNPVKPEQVANAVMEWCIRFNNKKTPEEAAALTDMYYRDLLYREVSEKEFEILKQEVSVTSRFFPSVAEILDARNIFVDGIFEPNEADKRAAIVNPSYRYGSRKVYLKQEMIEKIEADYGPKQIGGGLGGMLKDIE